MIVSSTFFANLSFLFLFLAMAFYWVDLAFFNPEIQSEVGKSSTVAINISEAQVPSQAAKSQRDLQKANSTLSKFSLGPATILLANLSLIFLLLVRWKESGHFPLSNLYESLMFLSWSCTSILLFLIFSAAGFSQPNNLVLENTQTNKISTNLQKKTLFLEKVLGAILAPAALFLNAFATFSLPKEMQLAGPLVPALQSNWLMMHVSVMIISYAALILGSLLSIVFLISIYFKLFFFKKLNSKKPATDQNNFSDNNTLVNTTSFAIKKEGFFNNLTIQSQLDSNLDYLSYRIIGIGFPFLTIGILSGAVWANEAWGSYWSWDPKETWALLTWLIFAIYLHTRISKGWQGEKPAFIAAGGFIVVWICYLGVNLIGEGLHSYGFFS